MTAIVPMLHENGGPIIAVQLDNEVGMLDWVSNTPDLTDHVIASFLSWLRETYSESEDRYPIPLTAEAIRSPDESYTAMLHLDLGYFMRQRFALYIKCLRGYAEMFGVHAIPFIVNIHGTGGGRGFTFPIGISQLYESYTQAPGYLSGSDIYFGDLTMETFQDLYLINGMMDAVHRPEQPLSSIEFNCGDGNFGENYGGRYDPSAADLKARMCIAQGNRLLNYYLFAGGQNYRFNQVHGDGNDRIAATGERHGFAAPIDPEGYENYTYPRMAESIQTVMAQKEQLAAMEEERDSLVFGFIPDYFMTEYRYPKSHRMKMLYQNLETYRAHGAWEIMGRALLLANYRFTGHDVQNKELDPSEQKAIVLPSASYMSRSIQKKLVTYMKNGGTVLLYGEAPTYDMEGNKCQLLLEAANVEVVKTRHATEKQFLSVVARGLASPRPEVRTHVAQVFSSQDAEPIFQLYGTDELTSFKEQVGQGTLMVIGNAYRCDIDLFQKLLTSVGVQPTLSHDYKHHGLFMTSTRDEKGQRFIHVLNLDGLEKSFAIYEHKQMLFNRVNVHLDARAGLLLPLNVSYGSVKILYATAEVKWYQKTSMTFKGSRKGFVIFLQTKQVVQVGSGVMVKRLEKHHYLLQAEQAECTITFR